MVKFCKWCGVEKPLTEYHRNPRNRPGHRNKCIECTLAYEKQRRLDKEMGPRIRANDRSRLNKDERTLASCERAKERLRGSEEAKLARQESVKAWRRQNPEKASAQKEVNKATRSGKLVRPEQCTRCDSTTNIQGHHWSYLEENWLDVIWLCPKCHGEEHARLRDLDRDPDSDDPTKW